ncbi:hypothetical protein EAF04_003615 [Stromatinia cepivora]|nr:hypothetical protein EAF04_003615 [Stromatinia cepivora]
MWSFLYYGSLCQDVDYSSVYWKGQGCLNTPSSKRCEASEVLKTNLVKYSRCTPDQSAINSPDYVIFGNDAHPSHQVPSRHPWFFNEQELEVPNQTSSSRFPNFSVGTLLGDNQDAMVDVARDHALRLLSFLAPH